MKASFFPMIRFDRLLTLNLFGPLMKRIKVSNKPRIPILMYHSLSDDTENGIHPYYRINTSPKIFAEQMKFLHDNNYKVISLSEAMHNIESQTVNRESQGVSGKTHTTATHNNLLTHSLIKSTNPSNTTNSINLSNPVVLTFDDGYHDFLEKAFPILEKYEFTATIFLPTGFISDGGLSFKGKRCLHWREVRELAASGVQFGSHTISHPNLRDLHLDQVEREIWESKEILENRIGTRVDSFSYPYAFPEEDPRFKRRIRTSLAKAGYTIGVTTIIGTATQGNDRLFLKRIPVNSVDDPAFFRAKLDGGYDWIRGLQYGLKILKWSLAVFNLKQIRP